MQITVKFWNLRTEFSNLNYIGKNIGPSNWYQIVWTIILKGDECLNNKNGLAVCVPNTKCDMRVTNYRTPHFPDKSNEVTSFNKKIKDSSPAET